MIGFLLLFVASASAHPVLVGVQSQPDLEDTGFIMPSKAFQGYAPSGYAAPSYGFYGMMPSHHHQAYAPAFQPAMQQVAMPHHQHIIAQTAVVQQQPIGVVQNQASGPTQIYKPGPSPPMVVNPAPVVVRPPPPPPIYVQPQKIFVQPPQVPPVYASNPQVYYAQQNCPNCPPGMAPNAVAAP